MNFIRKMFDHEYKELKKFRSQADAIMELDEEMSKLTDTELKAKTEEFKERLKKGETLDGILVIVFVCCNGVIFADSNCTNLLEESSVTSK